MSKTIFQDSYLVEGIMCFSGCGKTVQFFLNNCLDEIKQQKNLPEDAQLFIDAEPSGLGLQRLILTIKSDDGNFVYAEDFHPSLRAQFEESLNTIEKKVIKYNANQDEESNTSQWFNIIFNLIALAAILVLYLVFPPSIPLTIMLVALSFLTTAFTAREYLISFFHNLINRNLASMSTTISLGWFLSLGHTLYHTILMPLASSFSMLFMSFLMPVMLITCINAMDEIKRLVLNRSKKMNLEGMKNLFPQMSETYACCQLEKEESLAFTKWIKQLDGFQTTPEFLGSKNLVNEQKNLLQEGMIIQINPGQCFPVDCILIDENTIIDASLVSGEPRQAKKMRDEIPAGAINFGQAVKVYALNNSYNSTINQILFPANRARSNPARETSAKFQYFYSALVVAGIIAAIACPIVFGSFTVSILMLNLIGILCAICPCTIAIALQLPSLISLFHRNRKGIQLREESLTAGTDEIHTLVFDKTGTLTTGDCLVESTTINSTATWERIHWLETLSEHPLAKAITKYYKPSSNVTINDIQNSKIDSKNRGLSAVVQGVPIHIGNAAYLKESGVKLPDLNGAKLEQGFTPVYVAENSIYQGVIYIKHEVRPGIVETLTRLKKEKKKLRLIMLTGDSEQSALWFNKQNGALFKEYNIHAEQTPEDKEKFLKNLMDSPNINPKGVWFVGDGLNDAPCARLVSEKGGVSCAMNTNDKAAFFSDICLNGGLDYLCNHNKINQFLQKSILQNKAILSFSTLSFLAFIIGFSVVGIGVSPLIPLLLMVSTTLMVIFNSYRTQLSIDTALDKTASWPKQFLTSDLSLTCLLGASALLVCAIIIATVATGGFALPVFVFTAGLATALSSSFSLAALTMLSVFFVALASYVVVEHCSDQPRTEDLALSDQATGLKPMPSSSDLVNLQTYQFSLGNSHKGHGTKAQPALGSSESQTITPAFLQSI